MSFLYFVPGMSERGDPLQIMPDSLRYAFDGSPRRRTNSRGIDECGPGCILADKAAQVDVKIDLARQTWRKTQAGYYVGFEEPPTPESLERDLMLDGDLVLLADGNQWQVPRARSFVEVDGTACPNILLSRVFTLGDDDEIVYGDVEKQFAPLHEVAMQWWVCRYWEIVRSSSAKQDETEEDIPPPPMTQDVVEWAIQVLAFNYRVSRYELLMLGALADSPSREVLDAAIDFAAFLEIIKKNQPAGGSNTNRGATSELEPIYPQSPTS